MKIHEYQGKELFRSYNIPVPNGIVATTPEEAKEAAIRLGTPVVVVKAQIHAGGRGKGGGIKIAKSPEEAAQKAAELLGKPLVTPQTGPEGRIVNKVLIEQGLDIAKEYYLGIVLDRQASLPVVMASAEGGMDIETLAKERPEALIRFHVRDREIRQHQARRFAYGIGIPTDSIPKAIHFLTQLFKLFVEKDATLAEINPLLLSKQGDVLALDAKINFDDNALFKHPEIVALRDIGEEDPFEVKASRYGLNYVKLEGTVGCMVNGAGLAMATMDIIKLAGGQPANFLDVGGGAKKDQIVNAFRILTSDPDVQAVLINIFGGILRCDVLAQGVVDAASELDLKLPVVVRMEGTNVEKGREILLNSGLKFTVADSMKDAAEKVVALAR
ncbi:ADP-forming succinate--CoA ligase subunit beta [bacterium]|nr:ADP-forming succinate--CoA ligase subunit beta [bacterium]MCI0604980.1 ADP-forming succinate--CoA ligase subunit beta [bacterium]